MNAGPTLTTSSGLSDADITALEAKGIKNGWTFKVSKNPATQYDLSELTGLVVPDDWRRDAPFDNSPPRSGVGFPATFDWRDIGGSDYLTPVRDQAGCGSCWAFALYGSFESGLRRKYGLSTDLSEQWLVSCCGLGGCDGEWPGTAANFLLGTPAYADACGGSGAVLESALPYAGYDASCSCPYDHPYTIENWSFIGPEWGTPSQQQLKQAILDHGPITVCVTANSAFMSYGGGIFNASDESWINHAVVLVGWDDDQGENGVWIMRNSWGPGWGEGGYMRIEYGTSNIGYNALYVDVGDTTNGACCFDGGCLFGPEANCDSIGGTFLGAGEVCMEDTCSLPCPPDIDGDGTVGVDDLLAAIGGFGLPCDDCPEDVDGSGAVDTDDLLAIIARWGACP
ncbi:MAG: hypothetical protein MK116_07195 [Phycisphaerales bacterium]|nr:hypothetical protein [Phycisphaerales bacterium]